MKENGFGLIVVFISLVGLSGCLKNENVTPTPTPTSSVSMYHSSPDAPDVNIIIDNVVITTQAFKYKNYTNYVELDAGNRNFRLNNFSNGGNLVDSTFKFEADKSYSLFLINNLANIELLRTEDVSTLPSSGMGMVRLIHLIPDAPEIDITWEGQTSPVFSNQAFKQPSAYKEVHAETYSMIVKVKGGTSFTVPNIQVKEGGYFTILVEGLVAAPTGTSAALGARIVP